MATDQQFCLRWNNHQSTLISVFDSLLENGTLVDCTLAAEGQYLKAHKVVLSACSPYFEALLSLHYEKHPIVILKDVKFTELKSMMDYMYRGEVNISQDQLGTFLKAAESLQIKGLSENGDDARDVGSTAPKRQESTPSTRPSVTQVRAPAESKRPAPSGDLSDASRDGSISPLSVRKRRRTRRPSQEDDADLDSSNNCDLPPAQSTPVPNATIVPTPVQSLPKQIVKQEQPSTISRLDTMPMQDAVKKEIIDPPSEPLLEPKTEYLDYMNNENSIEVEDLTLDDDDEELDTSMDASRPGPSHGDMSNQGYPPWPMGDQSGTDEIFMAAQEAVGAATAAQQQRDSQDVAVKKKKKKTIKVRSDLFEVLEKKNENKVVAIVNEKPSGQASKMLQIPTERVSTHCDKSDGAGSALLKVNLRSALDKIVSRGVSQPIREISQMRPEIIISECKGGICENKPDSTYSTENQYIDLCPTPGVSSKENELNLKNNTSYIKLVTPRVYPKVTATKERKSKKSKTSNSNGPVPSVPSPCSSQTEADELNIESVFINEKDQWLIADETLSSGSSTKIFETVPLDKYKDKFVSLASAAGIGEQVKVNILKNTPPMKSEVPKSGLDGPQSILVSHSDTSMKTPDSCKRGISWVKNLTTKTLRRQLREKYMVRKKGARVFRCEYCLVDFHTKSEMSYHRTMVHSHKSLYF